MPIHRRNFLAVMQGGAIKAGRLATLAATPAGVLV